MPKNKKNEPIKQAIITRHVECLKILLAKNLRSKSETRDSTPIIDAIKNFQTDAVPLLLEAGEDPSKFTPQKIYFFFLITFHFNFFVNECALEVACIQQQVAVVQALCDKMTCVDIPYEVQDQGAVHWICISHNPEIARIILSKGINNVNRLDKDGHMGPYYMLDIGEEDENIEVLELLYQEGLDINKKTPKTASILGEYVISISKPLKIIEWLLAHGADMNSELTPGQTILEFMNQSKELKPLAARYSTQNAEAAKK